MITMQGLFLRFAMGVLFFLLSSRVDAERIGNFDIVVQPVNVQESSTTTSQWTGYYTHKEKTQSLVYKVRIDYKGLAKLEDITVFYIVHFVGSSAGTPEKTKGGRTILRGKRQYPTVDPLDKLEFNTTGIQNNYSESRWHDGDKSVYGKASLKGVTIRVESHGSILAEFSSPSSTKDLWFEVEDFSKANP